MARHGSMGSWLSQLLVMGCNMQDGKEAHNLQNSCTNLTRSFYLEQGNGSRHNVYNQNPPTAHVGIPQYYLKHLEVVSSTSLCAFIHRKRATK